MERQGYWPVPHFSVDFEDDGAIRVMVDDWSRQMWFAHELLRPGSAIIAYDKEKGTITLTVANGRAVYRIERWECAPRLCLGILVEAELDLPRGDNDNSTQVDA